MAEIASILPTNLSGTHHSSKSPKLSLEKTRLLATQILRLTRPYTDQMGRSIALWAAPQCRLVASVSHPDGSLRLVSPLHIRNPLSPTDTPFDLYFRFLYAPENCEWDFILGDNGTLTIWPKLRAAGWQDAVPPSRDNCHRVNHLFRGKTQAEACQWFYSNGFQVVNSQDAKIILHFPETGHENKVPAKDPTIPTQLEKGWRIKGILEPKFTDSENERGETDGRGITFQHPKDRRQTTFNIDYSQYKGKDGKWERDKNGGYHIDIKGTHLKGKSQKIKISTRETYEHNRRADALSKFVVRTGKTGLMAALLFSNSLFGKTPADKQFRQTLQQTHLTESYNGSHPGRPVAARGAGSGQIGGVGHKLGMIEGLFDHPEALFEREHYFMVPMEGEKVPFGERDLQLILRELAIGIYAHEAVPFFSLEFNQDGHLFPVIHPVYEGTLVGRVIGMLDYMMKGFLNGGVFHEEFVDRWRAHPNWDRTSALNQMMMFDEYVKREGLEFGKGYQSFRLMIEDYLFEKKMKLEKGNDKVQHDPEFFEDYTKFSNSFRIIAKQGSFKRGDSLFMLDGDFDVFYTLQPDPEYQKRLDKFRLEYGRDPLGYVALDKCAKKMCKKIHDQMGKFPLFEEYFSMLNVINFFSSYFMTLKTHDTIPYLPPMMLTKEEEKRCPSVFPELPVVTRREERLNMFHILNMVKGERSTEMVNFLAGGKKREEARQKLMEGVKDKMWREVSFQYNTPGLLGSLSGFGMGWWGSRFAEKMKKVSRVIPTETYQYQPRNSQNTYTYTRDILGGNVANARPGSSIGNRFEYAPRFNEPQSYAVGAAVAVAAGVAIYGVAKLKESYTEDYQYRQRFMRRENFEEELEEFAMKTLEQLDGAFPKIEGEPEKERTERARQFLWASREQGVLRFEDVVKKLGDKREFEVKNPVIQAYVFGEGPSSSGEVSRTIAGGCGMNLKGQRAVESKEAKAILDEKWPELFQREGEGWSIMPIPGTGKKGAVFRMMIDQAPTDQEGYQWMENLIQNRGESIEGLEKFHGVVNALVERDKERFIERLDELAPFSLSGYFAGNYYREHIQDRMGRNLLHFAALIEDVFFSKEIAKRKEALASEGDVHGFLPIHYAAMEGNVDQIYALYQLNLYFIDQASYGGMTPMMVAIQHGQRKVVEALLDLNAELEGVTAGGYTPLMIAVHEGDFEMTQFLLSFEKVNINASTGRKVNALMLAAELRDIRLLGLLLEKGANPNSKDRAGRGALGVAVRSGNIEGVKKLAPLTVYDHEAGLDLAKKGTRGIAEAFVGQWTPIHRLIGLVYLAVEHANEEVALSCLEYLLTKAEGGKEIAASEFSKGLDPLFARQAVRVIDRLLQEGISFNRDEMIVGVCIMGDFPCVREFLGGIAWEEIDEKIKLEGLEKLLHQGHTSLVGFYLEQTGVDPHDKKFNSQGWEYPHYLAKFDGRDLLSDWLDEYEDGIYPVRGDEEMTLPYLAAKEGSLRVLDHLLEWMKEEEKSLERQYGERHLLVGAFDSFDEKVILQTLAFCHDVDVPLDRSMKRAAHFAASQNRVEVLKEITRKNGDLEMRDGEGHSPLYFAFQGGCYEAASYLIDRGCSVSADDLKVAQGPEKEKIIALVKSEIMPSNETMELSFSLTEELDEMSLEAFLAAKTLSDKIVVAQTLPLEKMVPANDLTGLTSPLPLIFYLVHACVKAPQSYQDQLVPLINQTARGFPELRDTKGNTLSHMIVLLASGPDLLDQINLKIRNFNGLTPLHVAAAEGPETSFNSILSLADGGDLEAVDCHGQTPLIYGVKRNRLLVVNALIHRGANVDHRDNMGMTPLFLALKKNHSKVLYPLLKVCDVDWTIRIGKQEMTALEFLAASQSTEGFIFALEHHPIAGSKEHRRKNIPTLLAMHGDLKGTRFMMKRHRSLFFEKENDSYPWDLAALKGHISLVDYFFITIPDLFKYGESLLRCAALGGQRDVAVFLVEKGILNHLDREAREKVLNASAASNCKDTVRFFTDLFVNGKKEDRLFRGVSKGITSAIVNQKVNSLSHFYGEVGFPLDIELETRMPGLHLAASCGSIESVKYLAGRSGVNPYQEARANGYTALESAAEGADPVKLRYLLEKIAPPVDRQNTKGQTLLHIAARNGRFPHVMLLLDHGYDLNIRDVFGLTPQEIAGIEGRFGILRLLLFMGADDDSITKIHKRASEGVAKGDHLLRMYEGVLEVIRQFTELSSQCEEGETPLHLAVKCGWKPALTVLARSGFLEQADKKGWTPLHLAAAIGDPEIVRILIGCGAQFDVRDLKGLAPIDVAKYHGNCGAAHILEGLEEKVRDACA